jgi:hypothetical protein
MQGKRLNRKAHTEEAPNKHSQTSLATEPTGQEETGQYLEEIDWEHWTGTLLIWRWQLWRGARFITWWTHWFPDYHNVLAGICSLLNILKIQNRPRGPGLKNWSCVAIIGTTKFWYLKVFNSWYITIRWERSPVGQLRPRAKWHCLHPMIKYPWPAFLQHCDIL